jgi:hypothetical protein
LVDVVKVMMYELQKREVDFLTGGMIVLIEGEKKKKKKKKKKKFK